VGEWSQRSQVWFGLLLYTLPRMCGDVMYVCHSILQRDHDNAQLAAVDIKALADVNTASRCVLPRPRLF